MSLFSAAPESTTHGAAESGEVGEPEFGRFNGTHKTHEEAAMKNQANNLGGERWIAGVPADEGRIFADERAAPLLEILRELDQHSDRWSSLRVGDVLHEAVLACGFADEAEAWDVLMCQIRREKDSPPEGWTDRLGVG